MARIVGVRFRNVGKVYYFDPRDFEIHMNDHVIVETARGIEYGSIVFPPREVSDDKVVYPLKEVLRVATPDDVVGPILFLLGEGSAYMTGQVLHVNGGRMTP